MNEVRIPFVQFRDTEPSGSSPAPDSPPAALVQILRESSIPFRLEGSLLDRMEAAVHPDTSDLYPQGPDSGPARIQIWSFYTDQDHWGAASALANPDEY